MLESQLGVKLFDRAPTGLTDTAAGRDLAEVAARVETEVLAASGRVLGRDERRVGRLRVATVDFLFAALVDSFADLAQTFSGVELTVDAKYDVVSLLRREADVTLRLGNSPREQLVGRKLGAVQFAVYGSASLVERFGPSAHLSEFPWVLPDERSEDPVLAVPLETEWSGSSMDVWVLTLPELRGNRRVQAFMQHAFDHMRARLGSTSETP